MLIGTIWEGCGECDMPMLIGTICEGCGECECESGECESGECDMTYICCC